LKTSPNIPPIKPRRNPMTNPPTEEVAKLIMERIKTMTPHILWDSGLEYIITPPRIITIPKMIPMIPRMPTTEPTPAVLVPLAVVPIPEITAPMKA